MLVILEFSIHKLQDIIVITLLVKLRVRTKRICIIIKVVRRRLVILNAGSGVGPKNKQDNGQTVITRLKGVRSAEL